MRKDNTAFRERFQAWKEGKKPYQDGLPAYRGGKEVTFSDDEALEYIMALENPGKVGWDSKSKVWRTPKQKGYDKNLIAYGLDIREEHNPAVYNFLKSKGRLNDPWLTDAEAKNLMMKSYFSKGSSIDKAIEKAGGKISQRGYNVLRGMAWHGHPMKLLLNPDSITGKAFLRAVANGDLDLNSVFDAYYGYGSNAAQFADRIKADAKQRGSIIMETLGDGNKRMIFKPVPQWLPQPLPKPIPETQYPLSGSQAPESLSSWNAALSPSATPTIPSIQKLNNERNAAIQGAFLLPEVTVLGNRRTSLLPKMPSLNDALMAYSPLNLMNRAVSDMLGLNDLWEDFDVTSDLFKAKNGKLPRYNTGLVPGLTEERSDNTRVARQEVHLPVKRQLLKKLVTTEQMLLATENKPVVKQGKNYTQRRIKEETKHVPEEVYSTLAGIGIGSDIVGKSLGLPPIYSSLKAAKELSEGNIISGSLWALPFISEAKPAIAAELGPWWNAEKTWGKNFKFNNDLYYRSVNLDKGSMPLSAIDDANNTGIIRSLNKNFNGRPYFSVGLYENTSFPQASRNNAIIQADPNSHEFVSVGDFSHAIQQDAKILPGGTVMPIIKTPSATFPGGDLRSGAFSYWTPESLFGLKYWRNRNFTPNVNSALLLYIDALKSGNMLEAQNIIDNTYLQNAGSGAILNSFGEAENLVHTVGDSYKPGFRVFDPNIEGQNSFIYTTDAEGRPMSNSYTSKFLTRLQAETDALSRFNRYIKELENDIKYLKESIGDPNETSPLKESWKRAVKRKEDELTNKRVLIYNNFLEENLRKLDPDRELRLYGRLNNPVIVDAEGKGWNSFLGPDAFGGKTEMSTRELEKLIQTANEVGFGTNLGANPGIIDGAIIKNVVDYGGKKITDPMMTPHTVFEFASPKQLKLSQPVTFTEDNLGVWPWLRFDWSNPDMHFANGKSPIYIKPANRGKLTRLKLRTGKSESELYNDGNTAHKKMVVFARNARKWKH